MNSVTKREIELLRKILSKQFKSSELDGYLAIAINDAVTTLALEEEKRGSNYDANEKQNRLHTIAKNKIVDEIRRRKKQDRIDANPDAFESQISDQGFEARENAKLTVEEALSHLPKKQREAIELRHLSGYSVEESAKQIGISTDGMKKRLKQAIAQLKRYLREKKI
ncbi:MAG: RNA polymerase sigma factor [bacterium]